MIKLKLKWNLFWSKYHFEAGLIYFEHGNYNGAHLHNMKFLAHAVRYIELGGDEHDVFN